MKMRVSLVASLDYYHSYDFDLLCDITSKYSTETCTLLLINAICAAFSSLVKPKPVMPQIHPAADMRGVDITVSHSPVSLGLSRMKSASVTVSIYGCMFNWICLKNQIRVILWATNLIISGLLAGFLVWCRCRRWSLMLCLLDWPDYIHLPSPWRSLDIIFEDSAEDILVSW